MSHHLLERTVDGSRYQKREKGESSNRVCGENKKDIERIRNNTEKGLREDKVASR